MRRENLPDLFRQQLAEFLDLLGHERLHERDRLLTVAPVVPSTIEEMGVSRLECTPKVRHEKWGQVL